ncbi:MAG: FAD-binding oxidoreductase, partial [Cytophagaceae bacterium]
MKNFSGESISYWNQSTILPHHGALRTGHETDVCVVGAGIAGLTSAYLLLQAGKTVTVLEQGQISGG